jgi:hypothetical protein
MVPLRIAFDMDGTLADLSSAYAEIERQFVDQAKAEHEKPAPEAREREQTTESRAGSAKSADDEKPADERRRRARETLLQRDRVWRAIESTPDFWTTLEPLEPGVVRRLYELAEEHRWEVFFITQRPATAGGTVQRQTYRWLVAHGFETPSVIPLSGGRGLAASALRLDFLVDDSPQNCVDVVSDSSARALLLVDPNDPLAEISARRLGIGVAYSVAQVLDLLVEVTSARANPSLMEKLRRIVGWK